MSKSIWIRLRSVLERDADATSVELSRESAEEMLAEIKRLTAEVAEYEAMFDAQWNADMAGVQMWREAHFGNDIVLPDRKRFTAWILAEIVVQRAENEKLMAAIECALRQLADGNRVLATGTLADALSGDKHD